MDCINQSKPCSFGGDSSQKISLSSAIIYFKWVIELPHEAYLQVAWGCSDLRLKLLFMPHSWAPLLLLLGQAIL